MEACKARPTGRTFPLHFPTNLLGGSKKSWGIAGHHGCFNEWFTGHPWLGWFGGEPPWLWKPHETSASPSLWKILSCQVWPHLYHNLRFGEGPQGPHGAPVHTRQRRCFWFPAKYGLVSYFCYTFFYIVLETAWSWFWWSFSSRNQTMHAFVSDTEPELQRILAYLGTWNNHNSEMFRATEFPWDFGAKSPQKDGSKFGEEYWGGWSMRTPSRAAQKLPGGSNK